MTGLQDYAARVRAADAEVGRAIARLDAAREARYQTISNSAVAVLAAEVRAAAGGRNSREVLPGRSRRCPPAAPRKDMAA